MGIEDLLNKGKEFIEDNSAKIQDLLSSDQAEGVTDSVLDAGADFAKNLAPDEIDAKIDDVRATVDGAVGTE